MPSYLRLLVFLLILTGCAPPFFEKIPEINNIEVLNSQKTSPDKFSGIAIVSHYAGKSDYISIAQKNHIEYANKHGYDYIFRDGNISEDLFIDRSSKTKLYQLGLYWQKISTVKDALTQSKYKWVLWIDADAVFTNMDIRIESIIKNWSSDTTNFIIAKDSGTREYDCINSGVFLTRNTLWSKNFLDDITAIYPFYKDFRTPEQTALQDLIYGYVSFNLNHEASFLPMQKRSYDVSLLVPQAKRVPSKVLNAFYIIGTPLQSAWSMGDFIAHVAGDKNKARDMELLLECINSAPDKSTCSPDILLKKYY
jgi:hypothetical protein